MKLTLSKIKIKVGINIVYSLLFTFVYDSLSFVGCTVLASHSSTNAGIIWFDDVCDLPPAVGQASQQLI